MAIKISHSLSICPVCEIPYLTLIMEEHSYLQSVALWRVVVLQVTPYFYCLHKTLTFIIENVLDC